MALSTLTTKGQTTIPKEVREALDIKAGDKIDFVIQADKTVVLQPATVDVTELAGILLKPEKALSIEDMNEAIKRRVADKHR
jgi:antitoxin PrlF